MGKKFVNCDHKLHPKIGRATRWVIIVRSKIQSASLRMNWDRERSIGKLANRVASQPHSTPALFGQSAYAFSLTNLGQDHRDIVRTTGFIGERHQTRGFLMKSHREFQGLDDICRRHNFVQSITAQQK